LVPAVPTYGHAPLGFKASCDGDGKGGGSFEICWLVRWTNIFQLHIAASVELLRLGGPVIVCAVRGRTLIGQTRVWLQSLSHGIVADTIRFQNSRSRIAQPCLKLHLTLAFLNAIEF
jgi:hypothetical protein